MSDQSLTCDKCGNQIPPGAKFCPHCGDPVTEADTATQVMSQDHVPMAEIRFGYSSSSNFPAAVELVEHVPTHLVEGEDKNETHTVTLPVTDVEFLVRLWEIVGSWKSSELRIDGERATKSDLTQKGLGCFRSRQKAYNPQQYCFGEREYEFNIWGCKRLNMPLHGYAQWLDYGRLDSKGVWHFDKDRIRHELGIAMNEYRFCPVLDPARVYETLDRIPDTINPKKDAHWKYRTHVEWDDDYSNRREIATGIQPVLNRASQFVIGSYQPTVPNEDPSSSQSSTAHVDVSPSSGTSSNRGLPGAQSSNRQAGSSAPSRTSAWMWLLGIGFVFLLIWALL